MTLAIPETGELRARKSLASLNRFHCGRDVKLTASLRNTSYSYGGTLPAEFSWCLTKGLSNFSQCNVCGVGTEGTAVLGAVLGGGMTSTASVKAALARWKRPPEPLICAWHTYAYAAYPT